MQEKKYHFWAFQLILFLFFSSQGAYADKNEIYVGVGLNSFNYREYNDSQAFLDGESGLIPGVLLKLRTNKPASFYELVFGLYSSKIDYDGQTQTGIPHKTKSYATIFDGQFKLATKLYAKDYLYAGAGYRYWYRNIYPGRTPSGTLVSGVLEEYSWPYLLLGYQANLYEKENIDVGLDVRLTHMLSARMNIDFLGYCGYDNTHFDLGNRDGWRFAVPVKIKSASAMTFFITPYYEIIDIGKSNSVSLTRNGTLVDCNSDGYYDGAYEPRSETRNLGIELTWLW